MSDNILSIDAGTTNIMAMVVGPDGRVIGKASKRLRLICPSPGLVEQDPEELWSTTITTIKEALALAGVSPSDLAAAGMKTHILKFSLINL